MGSFGEDLQKLRNTTTFEYVGAVLILGLLIAAIALGVSYAFSLLITTYTWVTTIEGVIAIMFVIFVILQYLEKSEENALVRAAKIVGVSIIIALFLAVVLVVMGLVWGVGFMPLMIVYWIIGIFIIHSLTESRETYAYYHGTR